MNPFPKSITVGLPEFSFQVVVAVARTHSHLLAAVLAALLAACRTGSPDTAIGAATMTAVGISAAAASRAAGGCIAVCTNGTVCNMNSGLCERRLPGRCDETFTGNCAQAASGVATTADGGGIPLPFAPVIQAPDPNRTAPTIVPAAEQHPAK